MITDIEGGVRQVDIAQASEVVRVMQKLIAGPSGTAVMKVLLKKAK
jgi:hypothetical protein